MEWTIAFGFTFYMLTFFWDLRMAKGVHKGELSRQRLLAMQQHGQNFDAMREANEAGAGSIPNRFPGLRYAGVLNAAVGGNTHNLPTRPQRGALRG